jgi:hypothetical protein
MKGWHPCILKPHWRYSAANGYLYVLPIEIRNGSMSVTLEKKYKKEINNALERCQFIEEKLRACIMRAVEIAEIRLLQDFPVRYTSKDISKLTMGTLVSIFSKINADTDLLESLKLITKDRNNVAHKSLLLTLGELQDVKHMEKATQEMKDIVERATTIHYRLLDIQNDLIKALHEAKRTVAQDHR